MLAADQALLRALRWLVSKPASLLLLGPCQTPPGCCGRGSALSLGVITSGFACPARQGHTLPRSPHLGRGHKLLPPPASGKIRRGSEGLMKTDWQPLGRLILKRLSAIGVQRVVLICLPTAKFLWKPCQQPSVNHLHQRKC